MIKPRTLSSQYCCHLTTTLTALMLIQLLSLCIFQLDLLSLPDPPTDRKLPKGKIASDWFLSASAPGSKSYTPKTTT